MFRCFMWARENTADFETLHDVAKNMTNHQKNPPLYEHGGGLCFVGDLAIELFCYIFTL